MMMWPPPDDGSFFHPARGFPAPDDPDVRLTYEVANRLIADDRIRHQPVTVEVQNRVVLLTGTVDTPAMRQVVGNAARDVSGVVDVCNALRVKKTGEVRDPMNTLRSERDAAGRTDDTIDDQRFQAMIAALQAEDPSWTGRRAEPVRRSNVVIWALVMVTWAIMSVLMVRFGWAGVAVNCVLAGLVLTLARHRRMGRRAGASQWKH